ncbi:hypothetical protein [Pseudonocardia sp. GCM10023141]|uniref:hypothetical protein n=1 Tax=Pseudonocardia sp. GCM10023141 TaxID=3252653 RepID=UPI00361896FE
MGAYSYYDPLQRPISRTLALWLIVVIAVAARRPPRPAILHATVALLSAVIAFYVGKKVMYALRYPGQPYPLNYTEIGLWIVLAIAAVSGSAGVSPHQPPRLARCRRHGDSGRASDG